MKRHPIHSNKDTFLITPSLLNAWQYMWSCVGSVREKDSDQICLEDKKADAMEKAKASFIDTLNRVPSPTNEYMRRGIEFEDECYKGNTCVSPIIQGGAFQIVGKKEVEIDGIRFLLYGRLDVLKGGMIYDIKRVSSYSPQKYIWSHQHPFYMELFGRAYGFTYLIYDGKSLHTETYWRDECEDIRETISQFISWLKENGLLETYMSKWKSKY